MKHIFITVAGVMLLSIVQLTPSAPTQDGIPRNNTAKVEALEVPKRDSIETIAKVPMSCLDYQSIIQKYDWDANIAGAIMKAESSCNSDAVGDTWPIGGLLAPSCGLMQVRTISASRGTCEQLKVPSFNIEKAYQIYKGSGWSAWSMYTNKTYLKYL